MLLCDDVSRETHAARCSDAVPDLSWLGAAGLDSVLSHVVAQLTREIAVRMALGAERSSVRRMVVVQSGRVALLGVVVGIVVAFAVRAC